MWAGCGPTHRRHRVGAFIHGFVPTELVVQIGGRANPLACRRSSRSACHLYSNAAGTIPIIEALLARGCRSARRRVHDGDHRPLAARAGDPALGDEARLLVAFVGIAAGGIVVIGYLFNALAA